MDYRDVSCLSLLQRIAIQGIIMMEDKRKPLQMVLKAFLLQYQYELDLLLTNNLDVLDADSIEEEIFHRLMRLHLTKITTLDLKNLVGGPSLN